MEVILSAKKRKVIVVTGSTGTGKTKLGIELAKKYDGEVISADSMQVYQGLDIITNTVTCKEMDGVIHHCINFVPPSEQYNVTKYIKHTIPIIQNVIGRDKIPIIVGGTAYYIEALLWDLTFPFTCNTTDTTKNNETLNMILYSDDINDYEKLLQVDPLSAQQLHPNDTRKIKRSLEIFSQYGVSQSTLLSEQHQEVNDKRGPLRWDTALLFSLECSFDVLDQRLDKRVDQMVELGLCKELELFSQEKLSGNSGLLSQAIGYKEFEKYIELNKSRTVDNLIQDEALSEGLNKMKIATRRYARKQIRWIKNRLDHNASDYKLFRLDTTYPLQWNEVVSKSSYQIVDSFLEDTLLFSPEPDLKRTNHNVAHTCKSCDVICVGEISFNAHIKSRRHRKKKAYLKNKPVLKKFISAQ